MILEKSFYLSQFALGIEIWIQKTIRHKIYKSKASEVLESGMCDVIKIRLKRRDATRSEKENQPLNIKTAVEQPILKLGLPNFR